MSDELGPTERRPSRRVTELHLETIAEALLFLPSLRLPSLPPVAQWIDATCWLNSPPPDGTMVSLRWHLPDGWLRMTQTSPSDALFVSLDLVSTRQLANGLRVRQRVNGVGGRALAWRNTAGAYVEMRSNSLSFDELAALIVPGLL
jgi:hypothetical protein